MSQEADASGSREAQARPAEAHEEATCPLCLGPPQEPPRVFPCGHTFCGSCAEPWPDDGLDCPLCRGLVVRIPPPPPPPPAAATAPNRRRPRRRLRRSRQQRGRSRHRSRSVSPRRAQRSRSGSPLRLVRRLPWQREPNGRRRDAEDAEDWQREAQERQWGSGDHAEDWLRLVRERQWGSGDHARRRDGPCC